MNKEIATKVFESLASGIRLDVWRLLVKAEYQKLMSYMNREDPQAFITVYTVSDMR